MNKSIPAIAVIIAVLVVILARYPNWSRDRPIPFEARSDAWITEIQAGRPIEEASPFMQKNFAERDGDPGPLQAHRYLTPWLLRRIPGPGFRERWAYLAILSLAVMVASAWYIGLGLGGHWRYGAICAALWLCSVGWMVGRLPWHKDTVVSGLEPLIIALLVYKRWGWLSVALVVGVLCKESFVFLALAIGAGLLVENFIKARLGGGGAK